MAKITFQELCIAADLNCFSERGKLMIDCSPIHIISALIDHINMDILIDAENLEDPKDGSSPLADVVDVLQVMAEAFAFPDKIKVTKDTTTFPDIPFKKME